MYFSPFSLKTILEFHPQKGEEDMIEDTQIIFLGSDFMHEIKVSSKFQVYIGDPKANLSLAFDTKAYHCHTMKCLLSTNHLIP